MTNSDYRALPRYANSDLSELFNLRMGNSIKTIYPKAARFGTAFHSIILEPHTFTKDGLHVTEVDRLYRMRDSYKTCMADIDSLPYLVSFKPELVEQCRFMDCELTGLPLKCRIDAVVDDYMIDLKTTSARDPQQFFDCFTTYGYDRQAAFYLQFGSQFTRFLFVGVQKNPPFNIYTVDMHHRQKMLDSGRRKNERLLRDAYNESLKPDGWRPKTWNQIEIQ